jgi:hypothetical protein
MNQPEAKKTRERTGGGFCDDPEVLEVFFFDPCIEAVIRDENDGRAKENHALSSPNY